MSARHTPGPWFVQIEHQPMQANGFRPEPVAVHDAHGDRIAVVSEESADKEANARLIAAAPVLLRALETVMRVASVSSRSKDGRAFVDYRDWEPMITEVSAAVAEAGAAQ